MEDPSYFCHTMTLSLWCGVGGPWWGIYAETVCSTVFTSHLVAEDQLAALVISRGSEAYSLCVHSCVMNKGTLQSLLVLLIN